jgi:hypothetical protein
MATTDAWYDDWQSLPRFGTYLAAAGGNRYIAASLVHWDSDLRGSLHAALGDFEVALRNAYDVALTRSSAGPTHWLLDPSSPIRQPMTGRPGMLNLHSRQAIDKALRQVGPNAPIGKVIANLPLGFWRYLTVAAREKTVWVPGLFRAFPQGASRPSIDRMIEDLYQLRNRVAHHEPTLRTPVPDLVRDLHTMCDHLQPELGKRMRSEDSVMKVWRRRP